MPMIVPFIPLIVAGVGAATAGATMAGVGQPNQEAAARAQQKQLNDAKMQQAQQDAESKRKAILANMPNAQEQGGGALNDTGLTNLASVIAGLPGEASSGAGKGALSSYLGTPSGGSGTSGVTAGGDWFTGLMESLTKGKAGGSSEPGTGGGENMVGATYGLSGSQG